MQMRRLFAGLAGLAMAASLAACGSDPELPPPPLSNVVAPPVTTTTTPTTTTTSQSGTQKVRKCSLSERTNQGTCPPNILRPGVGAVGELTFYAQFPTITFTGLPQTQSLSGYLTTVTNDLERFWSQAYRTAGIKNDQGQFAMSSVRRLWIEPGNVARGCNPAKQTNAGTLSYCFNVKNSFGYDRMYIAMDAILADWNGTPLPGSNQPHPRTGEWSAIYTLAHEYGHNLEEELGVNPAISTKNNELLADCLAGVYMRGSLDLKIAANLQGFTQVVRNAHFSGDYDIEGEDHHGTPLERVEAVRAGIASASPAQCERTYDRS